METSKIMCTVLCLAAALTSNSSFAGDTHVISALHRLQKTWTYNGSSSSHIVVDDLKVGDIIDIEIPEGNHGFVTTKNAATDTDLVWACGQDKKPDPAVLKEINCGAQSQLNKSIKGGMQLMLLPEFKDETDFWCAVHTSDMTGVLKLKQ